MPGPPTEGAERIYRQLDLNPAQVARGWFGCEVLALWSLVLWCTGPTAARCFPASSLCARQAVCTASRCREGSGSPAVPSWLLKGAGKLVDKGNPADALYLGFHKAFDRISQQRLLKKLCYQGQEQTPF